jgi:hypothetical protein
MALREPICTGPLKDDASRWLKLFLPNMEHDVHTVAYITGVYSGNKTKRKLCVENVGLLNNIELVQVFIDFLLSVRQC